MNPLREEGTIPFYASPLPVVTQVLVFAPHPDDECFGCGGALALHAQNGARVRVVVVSDGAARNDSFILRETESRNAAKVLGCHEIEFWRLPDSMLSDDLSLADRIGKEISQSDADLIYAPSPFERHPDHLAVCFAFVRAIIKVSYEKRVSFYEVGGLLAPNALVDITQVVSKKEAAMSCFLTQLEHQSYDQQIAGLNKYRTYTLPKSVKHAEAFFWADASTFLNGLWPFSIPQGLLWGEQQLLEERDRGMPLVSVMIRSTGRESLARAMQSVANQTYRKLELIIINAVGKSHFQLPPHCGTFKTRFISAPDNSPLTRTQAANLALDNATGDHLLFLDDDDLIESNHIAGLVNYLNDSSYIAIYSATKCLAAGDGAILGRFAEPWNPGRLQLENFLPIHSVLFSRKAIENGCRFDESLDLYEDWDFWIQLSMFGEFKYVDIDSAIYFIHESSGVHRMPAFDQESAKKVWSKWQYKLTEDRSLKLYSYCGHLIQKVVSLERNVQELNEVRISYADIVCQLEALEKSNAWKLTYPLRWLGASVKKLGRGRK